MQSHDLLKYDFHHPHAEEQGINSILELAMLKYEHEHEHDLLKYDQHFCMHLYGRLN